MKQHPEKIPVMFDRMMRPEWLDYALSKYVSSSNKVELDNHLRDYLSNEIKTPTSLRKTVSQLQRTVGFLSGISHENLVAAHEQMKKMVPTERDQLRFELLQLSTPFVADCVNVFRKLSLIGVKTVSATDLYAQLSAQYGERGTIPRRVRYVLSTLKLFGFVTNEKGKWQWVDQGMVVK
ncbi:MAG: hypothetical protein NC238_13660 [Dehalobacter sp.]|nr:hypothetical protein [Dehalobacter sp.]